MNSPNAIAGSQAPDEIEAQPAEQTEEVAPVETETPETPAAAPGEEEGEPESPVTPEPVAEAPVTEPEPEAVQIKKSDVQKRIDSLTRRRYQLETQNTQLQNELEEVRRQAQQSVQPGQAPIQGQPVPQQIAIDPAQLGLPPKPTKEQYETNDAFLENMAIWQAVYEVRRQAVVQRQMDIQSRQIASQNAVVENWNAAVEVARAKYDDFDEVVGSETKIPQAAFTAIVDSPVGTDIAYYLGKHPEAVRVLNQMQSPVAIMRQIGKLEAQLTPGPAPAKPAAHGTVKAAQTKPGAAPVQTPTTPVATTPTTQKPKPKTSQPITPVGTSRPVSNSTTSTKDPSQMTYREYKVWREKNGARR